MKRLSAVLVCLLIAAAASAAETTVTKTVETFDNVVWTADPYMTAGGVVSLSDEVAPGVEAGKSMKLEAHFGGDGFKWFAATPASPIVILGDAKTVTLRIKRDNDKYGMAMTFRDGWGRTAAGNEKLEWWMPFGAPGEWKTVTFNVPDKWVRPVSIAGFMVHNWESQSATAHPAVWVDQIEVTTDLKDVDPATGLLKNWQAESQPAKPEEALKEQPAAAMLKLAISTGERSNLFSRTAPAFNVSVMSWKSEDLTGVVKHQVTDFDGKTVTEGSTPIAVQGATSMTVPLALERFGPYTLQVTVELSDGTKQTETMGMARIPEGRDLTEAEKLASPYGVNVHGGGGDKMPIEQFKKAGLVWFRDYAWQYDWLVRAKGDDRKYAGWPNFQALQKKYHDAGVMLLPCMQRAIAPVEVKDGKAVGHLGPDNTWVREIAQVLLSFPEPVYWELDNEYDLHSGGDARIDWRNYGLYHEKFAQIISLLGGQRLVAVEQGRGSIAPERVKQMIERGYFNDIGVVNAHHYCGTEAPELNYGNFNTGFGGRGQQPMLFLDRLRELKRAAGSDGKNRQSWLTEFGWDTLAGPVVTPYQQAVYLPRAWLGALAAGTDKSFWFYDFDAPKPAQFFDGCGLLNAKGEPKLSLCATAGMTSILYAPQYVGSLSAGADTAGYLFENDGKLVAAMWNVPDDNGPTVTFQAEKLYDYLGNPIEGNSAKLTMAPVYAVGLSKSDPLFAQTAYSLDTPYLLVATAGDAVRPVLAVTNNRQQPIQCTITTAVPEGWAAETAKADATVAPGETKKIELPFTVSLAEGLGMKQVLFNVSEGDKKVKQIVLKVLVQRPLVMQVGAVHGQPGETEVEVKLGNRSSQPVTGELKLQLPASWKAITQPAPVTLDPGQDVTLPVKFSWSADWKPNEQAAVQFDAGSGRQIRQNIIPNQFRLHEVKGLKMDGELSDWPADSLLPEWMVGSTMGPADAKVRLAWAPEGLYCAVEVHNSKAMVSDPKNFWEGDVLELFLDTADNKQPRAYQPGDHQFWFVPLFDAGRVYAGQWKNDSEIAETRFDLPGIVSAAKRTADGYVMEFLLPAEQMKNYAPAAGGKIGLNVNLTVKGTQFNRDVYWPWVKSQEVARHPENWGTMELGQ